MVVYERRPDRSWEPIVVPAELNPEIGWWISMNDRGAMGFGWSADAPNAPDDQYAYAICWCRAEVVVRRRDGLFGPVRTLTPAGADVTPPWVTIDRSGTATAIWERHGALRTADATVNGEFARGHVVARDTRDSQVWQAERDHPYLEWRVGRQWYGAIRPFTRARPVSNPGYGFLDETVATPVDGQGHQALVAFEDGKIVAGFRRLGASFGKRYVIARVDDPDSTCQVNAAMNAHRRVFAVWACDTDPAGRHDLYAQGAIVAPDGRVASLSRRGPGAPLDGFPGVDFDDHGRGVAAWSGPEYSQVSSLVVTGGRIAGFRRVGRIRGSGGTEVGVVVDRSGQGLATWNDDRYDLGRSEFRVASIDLRE
jgi:hypothetical protein